MTRKVWLCAALVCALASAALGSVVTMTGTTAVQTNSSGDKEVVVRNDHGAITLGRKDEKTGAVGPWIDLLKAAEAGKKVTVELIDGKLSSTKLES